MDDIIPSPWSHWRSLTSARIALGRAGNATPTDEALRFGWSHAMARDTIHAPLDIPTLAHGLHADGWASTHARSRAADRTVYLRRPDLGRQLDEVDAQRLRALRGDGLPDGPETAVDLCLVIGDGLSSLAVARHAVPLLHALRPLLPVGTKIAPVVLMTQARVAVADEVGEIFGAALSVILIGERPGLSSPDSLGIYLTHAPKRGRHDAERNCISNVRLEGLSYGAAAFKLAWLMQRAMRLGLTGVGLKDESDVSDKATLGQPQHVSI